MEPLLFIQSSKKEDVPAVLAEGVHEPDALAAASGVYIRSAGSAMLQSGAWQLLSQNGWLWLCVEKGCATLCIQSQTHIVKAGNSVILPPGARDALLSAEQECRLIWLTVEGKLSGNFMQKLGAVPQHAMRQGILPSQIMLGKHIVQSIVRLQDVENASSAQLQQLLWALLAAHSGQPVAMDAALSHEIAKVVDAMRKSEYRTNYSLNEMASISRMPVETFRKRFVAEVGMPPQSYQLYCKMEKAKEFLKSGYTVRQAGEEVGMRDPYHFSKTFKHIVGMNPSAYSKTAAHADVE